MKLFVNLLFLIITLTSLHAQERFSIKEIQTKNWRSIYQIVDERGKLIRQLDSSKYVVCLSQHLTGYFAIFSIKGEKGWIAIDKNEKKLFEVYNTSFGEPSPDEIVEKKIRIVDSEGRIGFADEKGRIIIKPQFEIVSSFHNGKAIVGQSCKKVPWDKHENESDGCHHYSIVCGKHGYINENGKIELIGDFTFDEIRDKIKWKDPG